MHSAAHYLPVPSWHLQLIAPPRPTQMNSGIHFSITKIVPLRRDSRVPPLFEPGNSQILQFLAIVCTVQIERVPCCTSHTGGAHHSPPSNRYYRLPKSKGKRQHQSPSNRTTGAMRWSCGYRYVGSEVVVIFSSNNSSSKRSNTLTVLPWPRSRFDEAFDFEEPYYIL